MTAITSRLPFHDPLTKVMALGIGLIIVGVLFVELGAAH
ncbi:multidrug transporter EmrE-like cation transporter [Nonomuraea endophytica]|uniref:Multidrug transporter EmrE-like cation transporter n=1 Tax=Nonomuraea endophytica TaxID=714136 RepID=A0A7W8EJR0_9ACTN|nr:multidrug transporter EmrE-like cation transporter [Nonomuraea endophytica]